ncbi:MAG: urease accessory protein UreF [Byssovorax sp.]
MRSFLLLQLGDSAFPAGGFAHSAGLEASAQLGEVPTAASIRAFFEQILWQTGLGALPFLRASHLDPSEIQAHDALCHAFFTSHVANRGSRTQGRAFIATSARVLDEEPVRDLDRRVRTRALHGHHAPLFGAVLRAVSASLEDAQRLYLHLALRGVASAAVRLGLLGPHEAQRLQRELGPLSERVLADCGDRDLTLAAQPAPLLDLFGALHDRLYARLFLS